MERNNGSVGTQLVSQQRTPHDPLRGQPRRIIFADTSPVVSPGAKSCTSHHKIRLGVAVWGVWNGRTLDSCEHYGYRSAEDFWSWVETRLSWQRKTALYFHNAHYNLTLLDWWNQVIEGRFRLESGENQADPDPARVTRKRKKWRGLVVLERTPYFLQAFHKRGRIDVIDVRNYFTSDLDDIAKSLGIEIPAMPEEKASDKEAELACVAKCTVIKLAVTQLMADWFDGQFGPWQYTAPALSYRSWYHSFRDCEVTTHNDEEVRALERSCYFGGRSSAWYIGRVSSFDYTRPESIPRDESRPLAEMMGQVYILDVRSMYPSLMLSEWYPTKLITVVENPSIEQTADLLVDYCCCANVVLRTNIPEYPYRSNNRVKYPVGMFGTSLCTPELKLAIDDKSLASISRLAVYQASRPFRSFIAYWWQKRQQAILANNVSASAVCKLMLNSLYGRFGMRTARWVNYESKMGQVPWGEWWAVDAQSGKYVHWRSIGFYSQMQEERKEHKNAFPAISAHVTAYGRAKMRMYRELLNPRDILYQDTDSLFVLASGLRKLQSRGIVGDSELGSLRVTHCVNHMEIRGIKDYCADGREVISGFNPESPQYGPRCWIAPEFSGPGSLFAHGLRATIDVRNRAVMLPVYNSQDEVQHDGYIRPQVIID